MGTAATAVVLKLTISIIAACCRFITVVKDVAKLVHVITNDVARVIYGAVAAVSDNYTVAFGLLWGNMQKMMHNDNAPAGVEHLLRQKTSR